MFKNLIRVNPGLNFYPGFFNAFLKPFQLIFSIIFRVSNHPIVNKWNGTQFSLKALNPKLDFTITLGYLNPGLNDLAQVLKKISCDG